MNFDEHDGHDHPQAYVSAREPRYVGVCPGHEQIGPWSPAAPVVPVPDALRKMDQLAQQTRMSLDAAVLEYDVEADVAAWFEDPLPPSTGAHWEVWATSELALMALRGVDREFSGNRYHVVLSTPSDERRARALARHFSADDDRFLACD